MKYELTAERRRYLKEEPKGVSEMNKIMEDMRNESMRAGIKEGIKEGAINTAKRMLRDGTITLEKIAEFVGLSVEEVKTLAADSNR